MRKCSFAILTLFLAVVASAGVTYIKDPKQPFEELPGSVTFASRLTAGDNVASCIAIGTDNSGSVVTGDIVTLDNNYLGQSVSYIYKGGSAGGTYKITLRCTTDNGVKVEQDVIFSVTEY